MSLFYYLTSLGGFLARLYTATTETTSKLVLELLYIDDLKSLRPRRVNLSVLWNHPIARWRTSDCSEPPKRGGGGGVHTHTHDTLGLEVDESMCVSDINEGNQYKFLGGGETRGEDAASGQIWSSPLSYHNRVTASKQFVLPLLRPIYTVRLCRIRQA